MTGEKRDYEIGKTESELKTKEDKEKEEDRKRIMNEIIVQNYNDLLNEIEDKAYELQR